MLESPYMPRLPDKQALKDELLKLLQDDLAQLEFAQLEASKAATHAEAKAESDKDTRAVEQSYLARGQAQRVEELRAAVADLTKMAVLPLKKTDPAGLGALLRIEEDGAEQLLFLAPQRGGTKLAGGKVQVVTPKSPLGEALLGARAGDDCEVHLARKVRELCVLQIL